MPFPDIDSLKACIGCSYHPPSYNLRCAGTSMRTITSTTMVRIGSSMQRRESDRDVPSNPFYG